MVDFDTVLDRRGLNAMAIDGYDGYLFAGQDPVTFPCPDEDVISMWVADMAFASCPAAFTAIEERLKRPILGYSAVFESDHFEAFAAWCETHYGWQPRAEHLLTGGGVVPSLIDLIEFLVPPSERMLTMTPTYGQFAASATRHDREIATTQLTKDADGVYQIDFDDFEAKVREPDVSLFVLCHPHNPTGRTWTVDELSRMTELCLANDVMVISDEIHCDLLRSGLVHTPLAKLFPDTDQIITCMSSSKTFNLAGLGFSEVVIPNDHVREVWAAKTKPMVNPLSLAAAIGVFRHGEPWRQELLSYLDGNFDALAAELESLLPEASFSIPDATYLAWVDLEPYCGADANLSRYFAESVGVLLEGAEMFIDDGGGHVRLNLACPKAMMVEGVRRVSQAALAFPG